MPQSRFWNTGVVRSTPVFLEELFQPKWGINQGMKVATAGSCFAQHVSASLMRAGFNVADYEPAPAQIPEGQRREYGYSLYSCRYGNIYTSRQLLQLAREAFGLIGFIERPETIVWKSAGRYFDALRPSVEPSGYADADAVMRSRCGHLLCVRRMLEEVDLLIFTLGLTEAWEDDASGTVYPTAPGVICAPDRLSVSFRNFCYHEVYEDLDSLAQLANTRRNTPIRILLTVSPVPLTATASGQHILTANTYSKATLRSVAGDISRTNAGFDYFPSFEIVTNPALRGTWYEDNLRNVRSEGVACVVRHFLAAYGICAKDAEPADDVGDQCEEALLEAFSPLAAGGVSNPECMQVFGDSHLAAFLAAYEGMWSRRGVTSLMSARFTPLRWMEQKWWEVETHKGFSATSVKPEYGDRIRERVNPAVVASGRELCLVGLDLLGNGLVNLHGPMKAGWENPDGTYPPGADISPNIPLVGSISEAEAVIGRALCQQLRLKRDFVSKIIEAGGWRKVYWVATPIMTQATAIYRLGEEYVFSGSQVYYNQVAKSCFERIFGDRPDSIVVVTHSHNTEYGFSDDRFSPGDLPYDTHVSPAYYDEIISLIFGQAS